MEGIWIDAQRAKRINPNPDNPEAKVEAVTQRHSGESRDTIFAYARPSCSRHEAVIASF